MTIHWCGTGLSAIPGLRRLIEAGHDVTVWNRSTDKAEAAVGDLTGNIHAFDKDALAEVLKPGDLVVSMLPATGMCRWRNCACPRMRILSHPPTSPPRCGRSMPPHATRACASSTRSDSIPASTT